ncbi:Protein transport protein [Mycena indigotica]|uniref:Protein transport protein n=1 Tax=Mycena indigotica TaxID=2126181 RepID=A0A8H6SY74_9AGAR|nr:Protein transport protein [Mycena indigotica]KAF7306952.1 Protein transport protein [Mycena indigotica]
MSFFRRKDNNQSMIPPTQDGNSTSPRPARGSANTYVRSRDGDSFGTDSYSSDKTKVDYNDRKTNYGDNDRKADYGDSGANYRDKYNRNNGVGDVYSRGGATLDEDRAALFSGYNAEKRTGAGSGRFFDGPKLDREPAPGEENEEDVEGIKKQTRYVKQESANSTRNALRLAREAEETARNTLNRLGSQSERLANTERHLDISKGHSQKADDRTDELNQLNRSIFRPVIVFNKDGKRAAQEAKVNARYEEERASREQAAMETRESHNRIGRAQTYGRDDEEGRDELMGGGGGRSRFRTDAQNNARKEQRKRYQFEATASDDEIEDEIDDNLDEIGDAAKRLKALGLAMGQELDTQIQRIDRIDQKTVNLDNRINRNTERLKKVKESLVEAQTTLFKQSTDENASLLKRITELERELSVWKHALTKADEEQATLKGTITKLEQVVGSIHSDNFLLLCLIDGDGNIFSEELLTQGHNGGRQAAMRLKQGITDYARGVDPQFSRATVWLTVFCNLTGLTETLTSQNQLCTREQFAAFVSGFNQSAPLFSMVDVGQGKEAADTKIKEYLRIFSPFAQAPLVFFGGSHDNGYTAAVASLENEGLLHKLVVLRGYKDDIARELKKFQLQELNIDGVFMEHKIPTYIFPRKPLTVVPPTASLPEYTSPYPRPASPRKGPPMTPTATESKTPRYLIPGIPLHKQSPTPCTFYYLAQCRQGTRCTFGHDYILTPDNLAELRDYAKKAPCPVLNRNQMCQAGDTCLFGHVCPRGESCNYHQRNGVAFVRRLLAPSIFPSPGAFQDVSRQLTRKKQTPMVSAYEKQRLANIERNKALLISLGLDKPIFEPTEVKRVENVKTTKKRKAVEQLEPDSDAKPKVARTEEASVSAGPLRRSARNSGKTIDYKSEKLVSSPVSLSASRISDNCGPQGREEGAKRLHDPKTYGSIPGVAVGTWWDMRSACSADAIHAPYVAGIAPGKQGAYSVALSGGYADDVDYGSTYTGSGGRDLKGTQSNPKNLRTAPQSSDQSFDNTFNRALKVSCETKKPVRVIRGFKLKSPYAPYEGYRYDGLYCVEKAWLEKGMEGFMVCKFAFKRLAHQPPLPRRAKDDDGPNPQTEESEAVDEDE